MPIVLLFARRPHDLRVHLQREITVTISDHAWIVERAKALGFDLCGIVRAEKFPELQRTEEWLARGYAGEMHYLADERRRDPQTAMPQLRSVIVCALNYNAPAPRSIDASPANAQHPRGWISRDARADGNHDHEVLIQKLQPPADPQHHEALNQRPQPPANTQHHQVPNQKPQPPADPQPPRGWISRYAWGDDYHEILKQKLQALADALRERFPQPFDARIYSDTGPINERVFGKYAGLGWLGRNTLLLNAKLGSWFFLWAVLTTLDLPPSLGPAESSSLDLPPSLGPAESSSLDLRPSLGPAESSSLDLPPSLGPAESPAPDLCGSCTRCIDACPTHALVEPYLMDSRLCIAYLTIELRGSIPEALREPMGHHVFGCDICQDVCPWNRRAPVTQAEEFQPRRFVRGSESRTKEGSPVETLEDGEESLFQPRLEWLASMTEEEFRVIFRGSPIKRTKWRGLIRNACIALGNSALARGSDEHKRICELLTKLSASSEPSISESAQWALARIQ